MDPEEEQEQWRNVRYRMKEEGFDYCFEGYSNWEHIKDEEFHKLRLEYLSVREKLKKYITGKVQE